MSEFEPPQANESDLAADRVEGEYLGRGLNQDRVLPALGEIRRRSGDVLVWDGSGWAVWTGARQEAMRVLAQHHETTGMRVAMGHTCRCGAYIRRGSIATHQVEALVTAGVIKEEDDRG